MKILHVETGRHFYGGAQQVVWLAAGLAGAGVRSKLVCPPGSDIDRAAREAGIDVLNLRCAGDLDVTFAWRLRQLLADERPHVVHCHSRRGADFLGGQAAAMTGIPAVVSRRVDSSERGAVSRLRYRPYRKVIAISEHIAKVLTEGGLEKDRIAVIRSAVDAAGIPDTVERDVLQREFSIAPENSALAVVAQLIPRKGHRFLFDALAELRESNRNMRVVVFGTGALESELRAVVARLNLGGVVQFAGFRSDLDSMLAAFDVLVHPATSEGLGVAMLKAAAAALPVIAFDAAGSREAVVHGETGLLVPSEDVSALKNALAKLMEYPDLGKQYGAAGRRRMRTEFSLKTMVARHRDLYEAVAVG